MKVLAVFALLVCAVFAEDGPKCQAPNGGGLQPVLAEFASHIPVEEVLTLVLTAMTSDDETIAVMEYLTSDEFYKMVTSVQGQSAFSSLMEFACQDLYVDAAYYFNMMAEIFGFPEVRNVRQRVATRATPGFRGLLLDIIELIPVEELQALFESKLATDYYVQMAFQKINSDEFGSIVESLQSNAEYGDMKNRLRALGVDVDLIIETINKIFH